jgi:hypothetical protein
MNAVVPLSSAEIPCGVPLHRNGENWEQRENNGEAQLVPHRHYEQDRFARLQQWLAKKVAGGPRAGQRERPAPQATSGWKAPSPTALIAVSLVLIIGLAVVQAVDKYFDGDIGVGFCGCAIILIKLTVSPPPPPPPTSTHPTHATEALRADACGQVQHRIDSQAPGSVWNMRQQQLSDGRRPARPRAALPPQVAGDQRQHRA